MQWNQLDAYVRKYSPIFLFVFVLSIIVARLIFPDEVTLTWQLVSLIMLLIIIPFVPLIKNLKYGDAEAELENLLVRAEKSIDEPSEESVKDPAEIPMEDISAEEIDEPEEESAEETEEEKDESTDVSDDDRPTSEPSIGDHFSDIMSKQGLKEKRMSYARRRVELLSDELEHRDPKISLSRIRWEIDKTLDALFEQHDIKNPELGATRSELLKKGIVDDDQIENLNKVYKLTNQAIHGKDVAPNQANRILDLSYKVLLKLYLELDYPVPIDPDTSPRYPE